MVIIHVRSFGSNFVKMFEKYPITCNSCLGFTVYVSGEVFVQVKSSYSENRNIYRSFAKCDWNRIAKLGVLGALENGILMPSW